MLIISSFNMRSYPTLWSFILCLIFVSCVTEFDPKLDSSQRRLVVEAQLTTKLGFQYVYLSYDAPYNATSSIFENDVVGARVIVKDDLGKEFLFVDDPVQNNFIKTKQGYNYRSANRFQVEVGRSYQLIIETSDNKIYESSVEKVTPVAGVESVDIDFRVIQRSSILNGMYTVSVNVKDEAGVANFYKWDYHHVRLLDFCREYTIPAAMRGPTLLDPCCQPCYEIVPCVDCLELGNDRLIDGNKFNKSIAEVPYDNFTDYYLQINQYSLSENAYKFWSAIRDQTKNSGGLFDVVPQSVKSNIQNRSDKNEEVIGYFTVSDLHEEVVVVNRNRLTPKPFIVEKYKSPNFVRTQTCFPCEERFDRTSIQPKGWRR